MKKYITMKQRVQEYLSYRRSLGFKLEIDGQKLLRFANYIDAKKHHGPLTEEDAIEWAKTSKKSSRLTWARRLETIRPFARYCCITDPFTQIPANGIFGKAHRRVTPYVFSEREIQQILDTTKKLSPQNGLRPISFYYLFNLLYVTGLRISEALNLSPNDVDLKQGLLWVKNTKFNKSRIVPLHCSTIKALSNYCKHRDKYCQSSVLQAFFINDIGKPITIRSADYTFSQIRKLLGWDVRLQSKIPRIYDLRHTFVCHRLLKWYEQGIDINEVIPYLSTYIGHVKVSDTYWYITGIPQLMQITAKKFDNYVNYHSKGENL